MSRLLHYGKQHVTAVYSIPIEEQSKHRDGLHKPRGLWVSVEGEMDWKEWCEAENFGCLDCVTEIILRPTATILRLSGAYDIDAFHAEYARDKYPGMTYAMYAIEWPRVAERYDGIIIAPYVWQRRLDGPASDWYYGWDCASGCIWNADAVQGVRPVELVDA